MITLYSGTPGSGKSYHMARDIVMNYRRGKYIFTNFEVDVDYLKKKYPGSKGCVFVLDNRDLFYPVGCEGFSSNFLKRDSSGRVKEKQAYIYIDECQINFDARKWNIKGREEWNHWFSEHRKDGFEVVLCTQCDTDIDKKIRGRIELEVKHFKVNHFKLFGAFLGFICGGNLFLQRTQWYGKSKGKQADKISTEFVIGHKKYFRIFNTSKRFMSSFYSRPVWKSV